VVVCDDVGILRRRLIVALEAEPSIEVVAECDDTAQAIAAVAPLAADAVFLPMTLPSIGAVRATAAICEVAPGTAVVVTGTDEELIDGGRAVRAGAVGFVSRDKVIERAVAVCRALLARRVVMPAGLARQVLAGLEAPAVTGAGGLPPIAVGDRERAVLEGWGAAESPSHIAAALGLSEAAVHMLAANALFTLHRHARTEAVRYAVADRIY
jgi:DNA-binding NarL/FixJ family response regulator